MRISYLTPDCQIRIRHAHKTFYVKVCDASLTIVDCGKLLIEARKIGNNDKLRCRHLFSDMIEAVDQDDDNNPNEGVTLSPPNGSVKVPPQVKRTERKVDVKTPPAVKGLPKGAPQKKQLHNMSGVPMQRPPEKEELRWELADYSIPSTPPPPDAHKSYVAYLNTLTDFECIYALEQLARDAGHSSHRRLVMRIGFPMGEFVKGKMEPRRADPLK